MDCFWEAIVYIVAKMLLLITQQFRGRGSITPKNELMTEWGAGVFVIKGIRVTKTIYSILYNIDIVLLARNTYIFFKTLKLKKEVKENRHYDCIIKGCIGVSKSQPIYYVFSKGISHICILYSPGRVLAVLAHIMGIWSNPLKNGLIQHTSKIPSNT